MTQNANALMHGLKYTPNERIESENKPKNEKHSVEFDWILQETKDFVKIDYYSEKGGPTYEPNVKETYNGYEIGTSVQNNGALTLEICVNGIWYSKWMEDDPLDWKYETITARNMCKSLVDDWLNLKTITAINMCKSLVDDWLNFKKWNTT